MEGAELDWWEGALEGAIRKLADDLKTTVLLDHEGTFRHAFALFKDFRDAVEALALIRSGMVVSLKGGEICGRDMGMNTGRSSCSFSSMERIM